MANQPPFKVEDHGPNGAILVLDKTQTHYPDADAARAAGQAIIDRRARIARELDMGLDGKRARRERGGRSRP